MTSTPRTGADRARVFVDRYRPAFRQTMLVPPSKVDDVEALVSALESLPEAARDLAEALLLGVGAGQSVPPRFRQQIDLHGEQLFRAAILLPGANQQSKSMIDPRFYIHNNFINPALATHRPFVDRLTPPTAASPAPPPTNIWWDAIILAAELEQRPLVLTRDQKISKTDLRRLFTRLADHPERWALALALGRASSLIRQVGNNLHGYPESRPRRLSKPTDLCEDANVKKAGDALLRLIGPGWTDLNQLLDLLAQRCPYVLAEPNPDGWHRREATWFKQAANTLHRVRAIDALRDANSVWGISEPTPARALDSGFILTPDREILVASGELSNRDYGRLCRLAPYLDGDVLHRHRLEKSGLFADMSHSYRDAAEWLRERSRTGLPDNVRTLLREWARSATRITLLSNVTLIEENGQFRLETGDIPAGTREISYSPPPPASFHVEGDVIRVPYGEDPLTLRSLIDRLGTPLPPDDTGWRWQLSPSPIPDPDALLESLRPFHEGELPGALEAAIHAAGEHSALSTEPAVILHLPPTATSALLRDHVLHDLLEPLGSGRLVVQQAQLERALERLTRLGFSIAPRALDDQDQAPGPSSS